MFPSLHGHRLRPQRARPSLVPQRSPLAGQHARSRPRPAARASWCWSSSSTTACSPATRSARRGSASCSIRSRGSPRPWKHVASICCSRGAVREQRIPALLREARIERITWNRDYGPFARRRDAAVRRAAEALGVAVDEHKDRVVFESGELRTRSGDPFRVYSPFRNAWWERWRGGSAADRPRRCGCRRPSRRCAATRSRGVRRSVSTTIRPQIPTGGEERCSAPTRELRRRPAASRYARDRDRPDRDGTSRLSPYLRFGAISVRTLPARGARARCTPIRAPATGAAQVDRRADLARLLPRDPRGAPARAGAQLQARIRRVALGRRRGRASRAWCEGRTGYPFVDAGDAPARARPAGCTIARAWSSRAS